MAKSPEHLAAIRCAASVTTDPEGFIRWFAWTFRKRQEKAAAYRRNHFYLMTAILPGWRWLWLGADVLQRPDDPRVTWELIRALCEARRYLRSRPDVRKIGYTREMRYSPRAGIIYDRIGDVLIGEIHIHASQRASQQRTAA